MTPSNIIIFTAIVAFSAAVVGQLWFMSSELIQGGAPDDLPQPWTTRGGVTLGEACGLVLQTYCLPLAAVLLSTALPAVVADARRTLDRLESGARGPVPLLIISLALLWASATWSYYEGAQSLLQCGVIFCIFSRSDDDGYDRYSFTPYTTISFTIIWIVLSYFVILVAFQLMRHVFYGYVLITSLRF